MNFIALDGAAVRGNIVDAGHTPENAFNVPHLKGVQVVERVYGLAQDVQGIAQGVAEGRLRERR